MSGKDLVEDYAKLLRETFAPLIPRDRPVALVDFPDSVQLRLPRHLARRKETAVRIGHRARLRMLGPHL
jgi:hypothetical protein